MRLKNYALARGHKELLMQSQTIPSSLLVFLADSVWSPGRIPNEINFARLNLPFDWNPFAVPPPGRSPDPVSALNLPVALTLCAPSTLKWSVSDPRRRTISPFSKVTVPEWIENRIKEGTFESLRAAIHVDPANAGLIAHFGGSVRQSCCHRKTDLDNARRAWAEADHQTHRAVKLAPDNDEVKKLFEEVVKLLQINSD